jgi:heme-degrading monooxygenase HmoA
MELPWIKTSTALPDGEATVMASKFQLRSVLHSPAFLLAAMRIVRQARSSRGLLAMTLRAHPLRGEFWTLSAWTDEAALREFARTNPHRDTMKRFHPQMTEGTFRFWKVPVDALDAPALWREGERLISS